MAREKSSSLGKYSDVFLAIDIDKEACPLQIAPTSSTTLTLALGDALAVCMMKKNNFAKEDFASFHPGGSLGKQLFVKVKDLMRTQDLPVVNENTPLKEAIIAMSEGMLGNVLITNSEGRLVGLLSDGDLRRALMREDFSMDSKVLTYACLNPRVLDDENTLASEALTVIEQYKIQLLVVVNKRQNIEGVLHIHDLVEAGIK
jgi:arabinose-5-phosphate isomerase